jgi:sugar O-acyltransferase (sialic acid O-acetyltransferase NeuD family)
MTPLVIVGAGGLGRETAVLAADVNAAAPSWDVLGFVDDDPALQGTTVLALPVLGDVDWLAQQNDLSYVLALGASGLRRRLAERLATVPLAPATLVHPTVALHPSIRLGPGTLAFRGAVLMLAVTTGRHVVIDVHCTVGHDAVLDDFTTLHPGVHLSGAVHAEAAVEFGSGAVVLPGRRIGAATVVGAGAVVSRDLPPHCTAVGVPARPRPTPSGP